MIKMKYSGIAAALALASAPVALQAASADASFARASAPVEGESDIGGIGAAGIILALAALGIGGLLIAEDDDDDRPISA